MVGLSAEGQIKQYRSQSARITVSLVNQRQEVSFKTFDANLLLNMQNGDFALRINPESLVYSKPEDSLYSFQLAALQAIGELDFVGNILEFNRLEYTNPDNFELQLNGEVKVNNQVFNRAYSLQYYYDNEGIKEIYGTINPKISLKFLENLSRKSLPAKALEIVVSFKMQAYWYL